MPSIPRRLLPGVALLLATPARAQGGGIEVGQPWTREASAGANGVGYMTLRNRGTQPDRLVSASSAAARAVELHAHIREGDVMRMRPVTDIPIPAGGAVTLQPSGLHLMLIGLAEPLRRGTEIPVTLRFERAGEVRVALPVQAAGARGPQDGQGHGQGQGHRH